jgi:hypothetical protein
LFDEDADRKLDRVTLFFTRAEAEELRHALEGLIVNPKMHHVHISGENYQKEITVCIYDETKLDEFDERAKKLIREDV